MEVWQTAGNLTTVTRGVGELDLVARYECDAMGRRTKRIVERGDRDVVTEWTYDAMGRLLTTVEDPDGLNLTTTRIYDRPSNQVTRDPFRKRL